MSHEHESKYRNEKFSPLSCAMAIELMSTVLLFGVRFVSHVLFRDSAAFVRDRPRVCLPTDVRLQPATMPTVRGGLTVGESAAK